MTGLDSNKVKNLVNQLKDWGVDLDKEDLVGKIPLHQAYGLYFNAKKVLGKDETVDSSHELNIYLSDNNITKVTDIAADLNKEFIKVNGIYERVKFEPISKARYDDLLADELNKLFTSDQADEIIKVLGTKDLSKLHILKTMDDTQLDYKFNVDGKDLRVTKDDKWLNTILIHEYKGSNYIGFSYKSNVVPCVIAVK